MRLLHHASHGTELVRVVVGALERLSETLGIVGRLNGELALDIAEVSASVAFEHVHVGHGETFHLEGPEGECVLVQSERPVAQTELQHGEKFLSMNLW